MEIAIINPLEITNSRCQRLPFTSVIYARDKSMIQQLPQVCCSLFLFLTVIGPTYAWILLKAFLSLMVRMLSWLWWIDLASMHTSWAYNTHTLLKQGRTGAECFLVCVFKLHGMPIIMISDNPVFLSSFWPEFTLKTLKCVVAKINNVLSLEDWWPHKGGKQYIEDLLEVFLSWQSQVGMENG